MDKYQLTELLKEMLSDETIKFNTEYTGIILIEIDGECVQTIKL